RHPPIRSQAFFFCGRGCASLMLRFVSRHPRDGAASVTRRLKATTFCPLAVRHPSTRPVWFGAALCDLLSIAREKPGIALTPPTRHNLIPYRTADRVTWYENTDGAG
ncbi:unnamed protein product, partial [Scytosiphon promiscuus]